MSEKEPHLNKAYYGLSVSAPKSYHHLDHGGGSSYCFNFHNGCLLGVVYKFILTVFIFIGIVVFLLWLVVRPDVSMFHVTDASLTEFNCTASNDNLHYNLAVNITIHNLNKRFSVYYDYIEARALFQNTRFDTYSLDRFYQDPMTTNVLRHVFKGQHFLALNVEQTKELNKEKILGVYGIDVKMYLKVRYKLGMYKTKTLKPKVSCHLHVPFKSASAISNFEVTKCDWNL